MKLMSSICDKELVQINIPDKEYRCDYIFGPWGYSKLNETIISTKHKCEYCEKSEHFCPVIDPAVSDARAWLCANQLCVVNSAKKGVKATTIQTPTRRALEWHVFCELNTIGDIHYNVRFESIQQSEGKIEYLKKYVVKPNEILLMQGEPGTGKTYASMAVCEKFTRTNTSCLFITQKQLFNSWQETFKAGNSSNIVNQVLTVKLLVIDDFGIKDNSASFMDFFMEIINTRMQWTDRGTIITTNLTDEVLAQFCGRALTDRILTGQQFKFPPGSRRKNPVL